MRRFFRISIICLLCGILSCPLMEGRGRTTSAENRSERVSSASNAQSRNERRNNNSFGNRRPANNNSNANATPAQRPGNSGSNNAVNPGNRPGNGGNNAFNPGANGNPPGNGNPGHNPGNHNPGHNPGNHYPSHNPGHHPNGPAYGHNPHPALPGIHFGAPHRPHLPPMVPYRRPPRPAFIPAGGPVISTILGVALGTAINLSINNLLYNGYDVAGYGNDAIYLNNVMQLNMMWPNATLYYHNGGLVGSEFVYSTPYYSMSQYDMAYNRLVSAYGFPLSSNVIANGGRVSTWWSGAGQYISLQYNAATASNGTIRYYTTLSFGN